VEVGWRCPVIRTFFLIISSLAFAVSLVFETVLLVGAAGLGTWEVFGTLLLLFAGIDVVFVWLLARLLYHGVDERDS
jgi:hypothetical protein